MMTIAKTIIPENPPASESHHIGQVSLTVTGAFAGISTEYFDLSLNGPSGFHVLILHSEEYRTDGAGARSLQGFALQPGEYQLVLTSRQSPGRLSVHWGSLGQN